MSSFIFSPCSGARMITRIKACIITTMLLTLLFVPCARAAIVPRAILKTYFETGDIPSEQDFKDVIDSSLNLVDDGLVSYRIGANSSGGIRLETGATIDGSISFSPTSPLPPLAPNWLGQFGFLPLELQDTAGLSHYAFIQMQMASGPLPPPPGAPGPAISVQYLVFETDANVPLTTFVSAPEPTSVVVFCCIAIGAFFARRYCTI
jgi:hypothetical protein